MKKGGRQDRIKRIRELIGRFSREGDWAKVDRLKKLLKVAKELPKSSS